MMIAVLFLAFLLGLPFWLLVAIGVAYYALRTRSAG